MATNKALAAGITGPDGAHRSGCLLGQGYEVYGIARRAATVNRAGLAAVWPDQRLGAEAVLS